MKTHNNILVNYLSLLLTIALLIALFNTHYVKANKQPTIYGGDILENADNSYMTSVLIKNNTGLMGFKINLKYNEKEISIKTVTIGEDLNNGMFDNNIGLKKNTCDIIWTGTNNVNKNSALFYIKFTKEKDFQKKSTIKVSYSKNDTFDEKYKKVQLECKDIEISNLDKLLANTNVKFENTEVKESVDYILAHNDARKIVKAIDEVKNPEKDGDDEHENLAIADDDSATQNILAKLIEKGIDVSKIQTLDNDKQIEAVKKLYKEAKKRQKDDSEIKTLDHKNNNISFMIIGIVVGCLVVVISTILIVRKKKKDNNNEQN